MNSAITIGKHQIAPGKPCYIIAEMSANHGQDFSHAVEIMKAAKAAGANAVKLQTYLPETMTFDSQADIFKIKGTVWQGENLFELYKRAYTPWEWYPKLMELAQELDIDLFSTPFDHSSVDFLEQFDPPAYKIASFENVDLPLIRRVAETGKPTIISTGMASLAEIEEAVKTYQEAGGEQLILLRCTSAYPSPPEAINLKSIPHLASIFNLPTGLSDHTLGTAIPVAAVALGACVIEKHFTLSRQTPTADATFSLEPDEFKTMVDHVRMVESAMIHRPYGVTPSEKDSTRFRRSLFIVNAIKKGEVFTERHIKSLRPSDGLHTRYLQRILGQVALQNVSAGTPLNWSMVEHKYE